MEAPLKGITVVEMSTFVAGPVTARLLADMGATVIKVERPEGDAWRHTAKSYLPKRFSDDENPVFDIYNTGKKHIALNVKTEEGKQALYKLLENAQVFITNTRPKALKRLGLHPDELRKKYPKLVYALFLGYGEAGPDADMPAFDTSAFWARSGFLLDMSAKDHYHPVLPPYAVGDTVSGYVLAMQICAALVRLEKTGEGDLVKSSLFHNSIFSMGTMQITTQPPFGRKLPLERAQYDLFSGSYECSDGEWVFLSGYSEMIYKDLHKLIDREDLNDSELFFKAFNQKIREYRNEYYQLVKGAILEKPSEYWLKKAKELDMPLVRMGHFHDLASDPQAWANGYLEKVSFPSGNEDIMPSSPVEMESVGKIITKPSAPVGADTKEILENIGYTSEQIESMEKNGAVFTAQNK